MTRSFTAVIRDSISAPEGKMEYNRSLFRRVAGEYDIATRLMSLGRDGAWKRSLVGMLPDADAPRCVDLACGTGDISALLADRYPAGEIVGVDLSPEMLNVARERVARRGVWFEEGDMCRLDLPDGWADIVTGSYALRNAPVLAEVLAEVRRVLRPGGFAAFLDFRKSANPRLAAFQMWLLRNWCGLCGIVVHGAPEHSYIAESLRQFPDSQRLGEVVREAGFEVRARRSFMFGVTEGMLLQRRP
jgi:demethylmenaquinone methyltransferase/2-methoxy-6-polyprenyl-1,4-benzoquinol methylase